MRHSFVVEGDPVGKGRPRFTKQGMAYTPKRSKEYEGRVNRAYKNSGGPHFGDQPVLVVITAFFQMPASWSQKKRKQLDGTYCTKKPDTDNVIKSILDGILGTAYEDDKQVVVCVGAKYWAEHGRVTVEISSASKEESA